MSDYNFERVSEENLPSLIRLYGQSFKVIINLDFLRKKFNTANFGSSYVGFIAYIQDTRIAVGYYGVFPIIGILDGHSHLIAQSGDTMTHPDHQGKGLFTKLAKLTYELARKEGIEFVFGFPNKNSYPGFVKKLGWDHYGDVNNYLLAASSFPFDKIAKKFAVVRPVFETLVRNKIRPYIDEKIFENTFEDQQTAHGYIRHDGNFYDYKGYFTHYRLNLDGTHCVIKIDGRMWVGDIECHSDEDFYEAVNKLRTLALSTGCSVLQFSTFSGSLQDTLLAKKYTVKSTTPVGCLNLNDHANGQKFAYQAIDFDTF